MIRLLRSSGFEIEALLELRASEGATTHADWVTLECARRRPTDDVWMARKRQAPTASPLGTWAAPCIASVPPPHPGADARWFRTLPWPSPLSPSDRFDSNAAPNFGFSNHSAHRPRVRHTGWGSG
jgi:hypothetical protein